MKCPLCASSISPKDAVPLPRQGGRMQVLLCGFCGGHVALDGRGADPRAIPACVSCGVPEENGADGESPMCRSCRFEEGAETPSDQRTPEIAGRFLKEAFQHFPRIDTPESASYFAHVVEGLEMAADSEPGSYRLVPVSEMGMRALSLPGGTILAGDELLRNLEDEAELAFVLAREMAHQQSGRVARRFRERRQTGALSAGFGWGLGLLTRGSLSTGRTEEAKLREVLWLGYGASHEENADETATRLLSLAGYDFSAAVRHLVRIEKRNLDSRRTLAAFLDVHPLRSRRRCIVETLVAIQTRRASSLRLNREVYRRAVAMLPREEHGRRASRPGALAESPRS